MKRVLISILSLAILAVAAHADSVTDFLKVRKTNKIAGPVGTEALNSLSGTKILEIKATVKGIVKIGDKSAIFLDNSDGSSLTINCKGIPDWISDGGAIGVRMIIKASRPEEFSELEAQLVAAVPEAMISPYDAKAQPVASKTTSSKASKGSDSGLYGTIGRGGSRVEYRTASSPSRSSSPRGAGRTVSKEQAIPEYADFIHDHNKRLSPEMCYKIAESVITFSLQYGVDPRLVMAMAVAESGFNPSATSHSGAQGLLQLMPGTARGLGVSDSYDIVQNVFGAVKLISGHLNQYMKQTGGDPEQSLYLALAAYNAGSGAVRKHGGVPPYRETQNYVRKIAILFGQLKA